MGSETGPAGSGSPRGVSGRWIAVGLTVFILAMAAIGYWILFSNYKGAMFRF